MADWIQTTAPFRVRQSSDPSQKTGWVEATRAEAEATKAIPPRYRKGTAPSAIVEMTQAEKDLVDAALDAAEKDGAANATDPYVKALKKQVRNELNTLRTRLDLIITDYRTRSGVTKPADLGTLTGSDFSAAIRARMDD